jgi:hypothetical protein
MSFARRSRREGWAARRRLKRSVSLRLKPNDDTGLSRLFRHRLSRSAIQTSPGFAVVLGGFLSLQVLEHRVSGIVEELHLVTLFKFAQAAANGGALLDGELGQFLDDFCSARAGKLSRLRRTGKEGIIMAATRVRVTGPACNRPRAW